MLPIPGGSRLPGASICAITLSQTFPVLILTFRTNFRGRPHRDKRKKMAASSLSFENLFHVSSFSPNNTLLKELSREFIKILTIGDASKLSKA